MAGRKDKFTVEYFPHMCKTGKTLFILESKFQNDGYAVWFKTLELLGESEHHVYDFREEESWNYLQAKMKVNDVKLLKIFNTLSVLGAIDPYFYSQKILYSFKFIDNVQDAYKRRKISQFSYLRLCQHLSIKCEDEKYLCIQPVDINIINVDINSINTSRNTQSKVKESKVYKNKQKEIHVDINENPKTFEEFQTEMLNAQTMKESVCRDFNLDLTETEKLLNEFLKIRKAKEDWNFKNLNGGPPILKTTKDNLSHFYSWVGTQKLKSSAEIKQPVMFTPKRFME